MHETEQFVEYFKKFQCFSVRYLKKLKLLNQLHSFMDQFVHYIHAKFCSYPVFNIFTQQGWAKFGIKIQNPRKKLISSPESEIFFTKGFKIQNAIFFCDRKPELSLNRHK